MDGFLIVTGIIIVLVGLRPFFDPDAASAALGITLGGVNARSQTRAGMGGVTLVSGTLAIAGAWMPALALPALVLIAVLTGGLTLGRLFSLVIDGRPTTLIWVSMVFEVLGLVQAIYWISVMLPGGPAGPRG